MPGPQHPLVNCRTKTLEVELKCLANCVGRTGLTAILGVILFITPFVFGDTSQTAAAWTAYVGGALLFVLGGGSLLFRWNPTVEYLR